MAQPYSKILHFLLHYIYLTAIITSLNIKKKHMILDRWLEEPSANQINRGRTLPSVKPVGKSSDNIFSIEKAFSDIQ